MRFYEVTYWMPVNYCVIASSEEEAFTKAASLPFDRCDDSTWDEQCMQKRGSITDWDEEEANGYADGFDEFYIDDREVTELEFRKFGTKHLVTYHLVQPKKPDSENFGVQIKTKNIYKPQEAA